MKHLYHEIVRFFLVKFLGKHYVGQSGTIPIIETCSPVAVGYPDKTAVQRYS